jgi:hypothetical protein
MPQVRDEIAELTTKNEKFSKLIKQGNDFIQALWSCRG